MPDVASRIAELRDVPGPTLLPSSRERLQLQGDVYSVPSLEEEDGVELFLTRARAMQSGVEESESVAEPARAWTTFRWRSPRRRKNRRLLSGATRRSTGAEARSAQSGPGRRSPASKRFVRRSSGRTTFWIPKSNGSSRTLRLRRAATTRPPRSCAMPIPTRSSRSSTRASTSREEHGQTRYWMLETIRELAVERSVDAGEDVELRQRHAQHYLALALSSNLAADAAGEMKHHLVIPSATTCERRSRGRSKPARLHSGSSCCCPRELLGDELACRGFEGRRRSWTEPTTWTARWSRVLSGPGRHGERLDSLDVGAELGASACDRAVSSTTIVLLPSCCTGSLTRPYAETTEGVSVSWPRRASRAIAGRRVAQGRGAGSGR